MRWKTSALLLSVSLALVGCNAADTIDSFDPSKIANKTEHPLSNTMLAEIRARGMERDSPVMIRIFKEEGVLEIWKARRDSRFEKIKEYAICAWSGKLGPKLKEGDRQAPEGFYPLAPHHLNPRSQYYLAINTGFPNRYDAANSRNGTNLMIHGACSSSGCYSMTDAQILEIYAFARDAFSGGQKTIQLQAFPFRMTAENMARHRLSPHLEFWNMLKEGYDQFEVTKRPPEVNVCGKRYVFNQQVEGNGKLSPTAACPPMTTPPALAGAMKSYEKTYTAAYDKAMRKYKDKIWYDPSEAERKALVAKLKRPNDLAYAPTGSALMAGKLLSIKEFEKAEAAKLAKAEAAKAAAEAEASAPAVPATPPAAASVPVPTPNPEEAQTAALTQAPAENKSFWKFWRRNAPADAQAEARPAAAADETAQPGAPAAQAPADTAARPAAPTGAAAARTSRQPAQTAAPQATATAANPAGGAVQPAPAGEPSAQTEVSQAAPDAQGTPAAPGKKPFWKFWAAQ